MDKQHESVFITHVRKNYDALSRIYDMLSGEAELRIVKDALRDITLPEQTRLLDIGCGTAGALVKKTNDFPAQAGMVGVDISLGMCQKARRKIERSQLEGCIAISCANALHLPCRSGAFDFLLMSFTFEIFPDDLIPPLLSECRRVLKPSGRICIVSMAEDQQDGWMLNFYRKLHMKFPRVIDCRPLNAAVILRDNGFRILQERIVKLYGLPVMILQAAA